jgi:hypothetical protein
VSGARLDRAGAHGFCAGAPACSPAYVRPPVGQRPRPPLVAPTVSVGRASPVRGRTRCVVSAVCVSAACVRPRHVELRPSHVGAPSTPHGAPRRHRRTSRSDHAAALADPGPRRAALRRHPARDRRPHRRPRARAVPAARVAVRVAALPVRLDRGRPLLRAQRPAHRPAALARAVRDRGARRADVRAPPRVPDLAALLRGGRPVAVPQHRPTVPLGRLALPQQLHRRPDRRRLVALDRGAVLHRRPARDPARLAPDLAARLVRRDPVRARPRGRDPLADRGATAGRRGVGARREAGHVLPVPPAQRGAGGRAAHRPRGGPLARLDRGRARPVADGRHRARGDRARRAPSTRRATWCSPFSRSR